MNLLEKLKLDRWYGIVLYLGVMLLASSFYFETDLDFVEKKHLFGLGMILIGIAYIMSEKYLHEIAHGGMFSIPINKHNPVSIILIIIGIGLIGFFGFLIVKGLI